MNPRFWVLHIPTIIIMDHAADNLIANLNSLNANDIPPWASLLIDGMKNLLTEFHAIKILMNRIKVLENKTAVNENIKNFYK